MHPSYLWPKGDWRTRALLVSSIFFLVSGKFLAVQVPFILQRAVDDYTSFPNLDGLGAAAGALSAALAATAAKDPKSGATATGAALLEQATLIAKLRRLILGGELGPLGTALEEIVDPAHRRLNEVGMAWQRSEACEAEPSERSEDQQMLCAMKRDG